MGIIQRRLSLILAATMFSASANAANLMAGSFSGNQDYTQEGPLRLFPSGSFFQSIFLTAPGTVMISFSAVCTTQAAGIAYTRVKLLIDGVAVYPTDEPSFVLCGTRGPSNIFNHATHSFVVAKELTAGNHDVQMRVVPVGAGAFSRIRQLSLIGWN